MMVSKQSLIPLSSFRFVFRIFRANDNINSVILLSNTKELNIILLILYMDCSSVCLKCNAQSSYWVNFSEIHSVCECHKETPEGSVECGLCQSSVKIIRVRPKNSSKPIYELDQVFDSLQNFQALEDSSLNCFLCNKNFIKFQLKCGHLICEECSNQNNLKEWEMCFHCSFENSYFDGKVARINDMKTCYECSSSNMIQEENTAKCQDCKKEYCRYCCENILVYYAIHSFWCKGITQGEISISEYRSWKNSLQFSQGSYCPVCRRIETYKETDPVKVRCVSPECLGMKIFCRICSEELNCLGETHSH